MINTSEILGWLCPLILLVLISIVSSLYEFMVFVLVNSVKFLIKSRVIAYAILLSINW